MRLVTTLGMLTLVALATTALAQPPAQPGPARGRQFGGPIRPVLERELRNEEFAAKMKMTDDQTKQFAELTAKRRELITSTRPQPGEDFQARLLDMQKKITELNDQEEALLTPAQKELWEARKKELAANPPPRTQSFTNLDQNRIQALEAQVKSLDEEVKLLRAELAKLKAAVDAKK